MENGSSSLAKPALTAGISLTLMTVLSLIIFPNLKASVYSISGIAIVIILDVIVALSLYYLLKPVDKGLSLIMAGSRIIYAIFFAFALSKISILATFYSIWDKSLLVFGIHLFILGILVYRSRYIPRLIGIFVLLSSIGYIVDSTCKMANISVSIGMYTFWGEVVLGIWLIIKGKKIKPEN